MAANNFFFETLFPALYGQILGSDQAMDFSGSPYFILPPVTYGDISSSVVSKTATYTVTSLDGVILAAGGNSGITINLPTAVGISGKRYEIKKIDSNSGYVTVAANGAELIDGDPTQIITDQYVSISFISDGTTWYIL